MFKVLILSHMECMFKVLILSHKFCVCLPESLFPIIKTDLIQVQNRNCLLIRLCHFIDPGQLASSKSILWELKYFFDFLYIFTVCILYRYGFSKEVVECPRMFLLSIISKPSYFNLVLHTILLVLYMITNYNTHLLGELQIEFPGWPLCMYVGLSCIWRELCLDF